VLSEDGALLGEPQRPASLAELELGRRSRRHGALADFAPPPPRSEPLQLTAVATYQPGRVEAASAQPRRLRCASAPGPDAGG